MNILFARDYPKIDGTYLLIVRLATRFNQLGHTVYYLSYGNDNSELMTDLRKVCTVLYFADLKARFRRKSPMPQIDVISPILIGDRLFQLMGTVQGQWFPKAKMVVGIYHALAFITKTHWGLTTDGKVYRRILTHLSPRNIIFMHPDMRKRHEEELGISLGSSHLISLPVDIPPQPKINAQRNRKLVVSVGRLVDWKSYNIKILPAIQRLRQEGFGLEYSIYGDGPNLQHITQAIKKHGLEDAVTLKGLLPAAGLEQVISHAGVFVGCGTAVIQAAGWCVPTVVAIPTVQGDDSYGWIADVEDSVGDYLPNQPMFSYYELLKSYCQMTETAQDKLGLACYHSVHRQYNIDRIAGKYLEVYNTAIVNPPMFITPTERFRLKLIRQVEKTLTDKRFNDR